LNELTYVLLYKLNFLTGLANEAMDAKRSWTTELVDSSDEEYERDVEGREEDEELEHQEPPLDKKPKKVFAEV